MEPGFGGGEGGELDQMVRLEVMRGCELVQEIEQKMKLVPMGCLSLHSCNENEVIRASLVGAAAAIVSSFSNVITLFNSISITKGPVGAILRGDDEVEERRVDESPRGDPSGSSPIGTPAKTWDSPPSHTPPPPSPPSPPSAKKSTPSPQHTTHHQAPAKSDGRAALPSLLDLTDTSSKKLATLRTENIEPDNEGQNFISKRRKCMPNWAVKTPGSNISEPGSEAAPEDGYTWRKYGQKDILGSRHPRSYYRCSHKKEMGCPAIKYVQKSNDDQNSPQFHVTYRGAHTCQSQHMYGTRPYTYPPIVPPPPLQNLKPNRHVNSSCLTLSSNGSLQVGQCGPTFSAETDFQLATPFVSSPLLSQSTEGELGKSLMFKPIASFPLPEFARTPRFEAENNLKSSRFQPGDSIAAVKAESCEAGFLIGGFDPVKMMTVSQPETAQIKPTHHSMLTQCLNIAISEEDEDETHNLSTIDSTNRSERFQQLIHHLCLDDMDTFDSSADLENCDCPPEHFSPTLQSSSPQSSPLAALAASDIEDQLQEDAKSETQHIPSSRFEVDSTILDSPCGQQQLLEWQSLLFEA